MDTFWWIVIIVFFLIILISSKGACLIVLAIAIGLWYLFWFLIANVGVGGLIGIFIILALIGAFLAAL